jgi:PAS domain-containing protein
MTDFWQKLLLGLATPLALAAVWWMYRNWALPFAWFVRELSGLSKDVKFIKAELQSNGGGSLKDRVTGIDDKLTVMEGRQRGLIAALPRPTFEADGAFNWTECNVALERLAGVGIQGLIRRRWVSLIHGEDRSDAMDELSRSVADKRNIDISFRIASGIGEPVHVRMEASPIMSRGQPEQIICWTGSLMKVDDRRVEERRGI